MSWLRNSFPGPCTAHSESCRRCRNNKGRHGWREVHEEVANWPFVEIGLEKDTAPVYPELYESLWSGNISQTSLQKNSEGPKILQSDGYWPYHENHVRNALPIDIIIPNNIRGRVPISRISRRFDNSPHVKTLWYRLHPLLTFQHPIVVICAFKDVARTFGHKANLCGFTPTEQIQRNLTKTIVLRHVVHRVSPSV